MAEMRLPAPPPRAGGIFERTLAPEKPRSTRWSSLAGSVVVSGAMRRGSRPGWVVRSQEAATKQELDEISTNSQASMADEEQQQALSRKWASDLLKRGARKTN